MLTLAVVAAIAVTVAIVNPPNPIG